MLSPMLVMSCPNPAKTLLVNVNQAHLQGTHDPLTSTSNATSKVNYDKQTKMCGTSFALVGQSSASLELEPNSIPTTIHWSWNTYDVDLDLDLDEDVIYFGNLVSDP